ncbi:MAG: hypothetical protein RIT81_16110 [Deltaproteobacteria bacterium]
MKRGALALLFVAACSTPGPEDTLDAYRRAVAAEDWATVHRLSDRATREAASPDALAERGAEAPELGRPVARRHVVVLEDGREVVLVEEDGGWRVASGGIDALRSDTPAAALKTLWWALDHGRWDVVRRVLPRAAAQRLATDVALAAHVEAVRPRLSAAREALGEVVPAARVEGETAVLVYAEHRAVRFVREDGRWRIVDVE